MDFVLGKIPPKRRDITLREPLTGNASLHSDYSPNALTYELVGHPNAVMYQTDPPRPAKEVLPTMYDLPSEEVEDSGLPDQFHIWQPRLLEDTFIPPTYPPDRVCIATDLNLYYDSRNPLWYKRPDWFAAVGVSRLYEAREMRLSYVVWQEGVSPFVMVELLSPGTEKEDLGQSLRDVVKPPTKWEVYERILRIPYYVIYSRYTNELRIFELRGAKYQELTLSDERFWFSELELGLGLSRVAWEDENPLF
jgi:Uma2 family endonuclease